MNTFIDRRENMKNIMKMATLIPLVVILSACGGDKEYDQEVEKGQTAYEKQEFEVAITHLEKAIELEPQEFQARTLVAQVKASYFDALYEKGNEALTRLAFPEAKELFEKAYEVDQVKQPDLLEKKLLAEDLEKKQKQLDQYAKWLEKSTKNINQLSTEWRNASSNLSIGTITIPEFKEKMQIMLNSYQELITSAEEEILNISGELSVIHTNYLNKLQSNHEKSRLVIISTGEQEAKAETILAKGTELNEIQTQHALHKQALKSYAQTQGLLFNEK